MNINLVASSSLLIVLEYFTNSGSLKQRYNVLVKIYLNVIEENDKLREFIRNKYNGHFSVTNKFCSFDHLIFKL